MLRSSIDQVRLHIANSSSSVTATVRGPRNRFIPARRADAPLRIRPWSSAARTCVIALFTSLKVVPDDVGGCERDADGDQRPPTHHSASVRTQDRTDHGCSDDGQIAY